MFYSFFGNLKTVLLQNTEDIRASSKQLAKCCVLGSTTQQMHEYLMVLLAEIESDTSLCSEPTDDFSATEGVCEGGKALASGLNTEPTHKFT